MEPARVKVYGLVLKTRRRYLIESALGLVLAGLLLLAWWLGWPSLRKRLDRPDLPAVIGVIQAILQQAPWILLAAVFAKFVEMGIVLRLFARKEFHHVQTTPSALPGPGAGRQDEDSRNHGG